MPRGSSSPFVWVEPVPLRDGLLPFHSDPLIHAILARRLADAAEAADFLDADERKAPDPHLLPGMTEAAERIARAVHRDEPIGIFGDYDTDGVTSSALLTLALRAASGGTQPVAVRLPRRWEGYGLSKSGIEDLAAAGARLVVAVDCGSKDHAAVDRARQLGLDVVVLDHHRITDAPPAHAIIASAQLSEDAPYRNVSAAGVTYLLATALARDGSDTGNGAGEDPTSLLDLAMIGLVGDVSSLSGVNRPLVRDGLRRLRENPRPGLLALCERAGIDARTLSSTEIAFQVSPRLNAPGRLGDPTPAFDLLVTSDRRQAERFAEQAELANQRRKLLQERIIREIESELDSNPSKLDRRVLVFSGSDWQPGIVGLAAGKLTERYDRPVIVLTVNDGVAHGSARSVPGFDITSALSAAGNLLIRHGGHERAAGLALDAGKVAELDDALQGAIAESGASPPGPPRISIDADLEPARLKLDVARLIHNLGPFGEGNPVPILRVPRVPIRGYTAMGREKQHLKILTSGEAGPVEAILWSGAGRSQELVGARHVDLVGVLETNVWNGASRVQMRLSDFRPADD
ncbi:MAG TPA: single-stranded-DNA-specific exonuclease RecJ [Thermomicrobiales bacterium]|nr:single-stranded-DNA-specific exonuclease RecJ [Thermomicrobiales bacterium]